MPRILLIFGTRPEAIKMCPLALFLRSSDQGFDVRVSVTGQHREMLTQVLDAFDVRPDYDLSLMEPDQTLVRSSSRILTSLEPVLERERPDLVLVQGDTTTTLCGALASFYRQIPVGHVEAGLRTGDVRQPFPEEANRVLTSRVASLHFAATEGNRQNLLREGVPEHDITVTGNTVIDAVLYVSGALQAGRLTGWTPPPLLDPSRKLILVTAHRRESFGEGFVRICSALRTLARRDDVEIVYPVHPNPNVRQVVDRELAGLPHIHLIDPLGYVPFVDLMRRAHLILTDSGGVQEEAPSLGKPVLVLRETTERPEAVQAGTVRLVGTDPHRIVGASVELLENAVFYRLLTRVHNPYGNGDACDRISAVIHSFCGTKRFLTAAV